MSRVNFLQLPTTDRAPDELTEFEVLVKKLNLKPSELAKSPELIAWIRRNYRQKYVPERLLENLSLSV